jgi:hypothetical protein
MPKPPKPPLTIAASADLAISPPRPLGEHGQALWNRIQWEYRIADSGGTEILAQACAAVDRAEMLAGIIEREGPLVPGRDGSRPSPLVKDELAARAFVVRALSVLGLNVAVTPARAPGRPPSRLGW